MTNLNKIKNKILKSKVEWKQLLWRIIPYCSLVMFMFCANIVFFQPITRFEMPKPSYFAIKHVVKARKENILIKQGDSFFKITVNFKKYLLFSKILLRYMDTVRFVINSSF